jgi:AP-1-like transcription factor
MHNQQKQRARNRQSQKAFRERKEAHIRDLENRIVVLTKRSDELETANTELKSECARLRSLVVLLMGGKDESNTGPSGDAQTTRAMRLKGLLDLIDSVD